MSMWKHNYKYYKKLFIASVAKKSNCDYSKLTLGLRYMRDSFLDNG